MILHYIRIHYHQVCESDSRPSPTAYSPDAHPSTPKCIFSKAERDISYLVQKEVPGPAAYNISSDKVESPAFTLGSRPAITARVMSPGPTAYNIESHFLTPRWSFGTSKRAGIPIKAPAPGPGDYEPERMKEKGPSFSMKARMRALTADNLAFPGPTSYGGLYTQFD